MMVASVSKTETLDWVGTDWHLLHAGMLYCEFIELEPFERSPSVISCLQC